MSGKHEELVDTVMLEASKRGGRLWKNHSGVAFHKDGSTVVYGVANPGGSDMLGFTVVEVTADEWTQAVEKRNIMRAMMGLLVASPESRAYEPPPLTNAMRREAIFEHMRAIAAGDSGEGEAIFDELREHLAPKMKEHEPLEALRRDLVRKLASALASAGSSDVEALARIADAVARL